MYIRSEARQRLIAQLFIVFFAILPFSYVPTLTLGRHASMNVDISLIYIVLIVVTIGITLLTPIARYRKTWRTTPLPIRLLLACLATYGIYTIASGAVLSPNPTRGIVTASYLGLILVIVSHMYTYRDILTQYKATILRAVAASLGVAILFGYWQIIGETFGVSTAWTQLPAAYQAGVFGYARPTGLSWEPQFFGSLLVPAVLYLGYAALVRNRRWWWYGGFVLCLTITLLTLSRGAIYSLAIGGVVLLVLAVVTQRRRLTKLLRPLVSLGCLTAISILLAASIIGWAAETNQRDEIAGWQAIDKYIAQLSLDTVRLSRTSPSVPTVTSAPVQPTQPAPQEVSGYVESSTDSRLSMSAVAVDLWVQSPTALLLGVGFGGFGTAAHMQDPTLPPYSIVNNYYLEVIAETGLLGIGLLAGFLSMLGYWLLRQKAIVLLAILIAAMTHMLFYSGNANTLHIWVLFGVCLIAIRQQLGTKSSARGV